MAEINELIPQNQLAEMSRRDRKKQETRWKIFDAAIKLMGQKGYHEVKIGEICEAADVSNAAFFHHFTNKAALIEAYMDKLRFTMLDRLETMPDANATEKLKTIGQIINESTKISGAFSNQLPTAYSGGEAYRLKLEQYETGITGLISSILSEGQENGEFDKQWDINLLAVSLGSAWLAFPQIEGKVGFPSNPYAVLLDFVLKGLRK